MCVGRNADTAPVSAVVRERVKSRELTRRSIDGAVAAV
jgi:hypothetical protein